MHHSLSLLDPPPASCLPPNENVDKAPVYCFSGHPKTALLDVCTHGGYTTRSVCLRKVTTVTASMTDQHERRADCDCRVDHTKGGGQQRRKQTRENCSRPGCTRMLARTDNCVLQYVNALPPENNVVIRFVPLDGPPVCRVPTIKTDR